MTISHKDHDHPNTPAARAACRKAMTGTPVPAAPMALDLSSGKIVKMTGATARKLARHAAMADKTKSTKPTSILGDIDHQHGRTTKPKASNRNLKRPGTGIRSIGDLADVPRMLAHGARLAWDNGWPVKVGDEFTGSSAKVVIEAPVCWITLVWSETNPEGVHKIWVRHRDSSVHHQVSSVQEAMEAGETEDAWGTHGAYRGL